MLDAIRATLQERIAHGATLDEIDTIVRMSRGLSAEDRLELWQFAWSFDPATQPATEPTLH